MKGAVWKFPLPVQDDIEVEMPVGAILLAVQAQHEQPCLWALVNPDNEERVVRHFRLAGTGHLIDDTERLRYVGTFQLREGFFVGHLFERLM